MTAPTTQAEQEDAVRERYTVVYEGDSTGVKILSGEAATGRAVTVMAGDLWEEARTLRAERDAAVTRAAEEEVGAAMDRAFREIADLRVAEVEAQRDQLAADLRKAVIQAAEHARARGEAEGRLRASEIAGVVEGWREQNERLAADLREAREALNALREPSWQALEAARNAKINGSVFTMSDWVLQAERDDLPALGIPWPEMAYDRWSVISEDLHHLLLTTWWKAMFDALTPDPQGAGGTAKGEDPHPDTLTKAGGPSDA